MVVVGGPTASGKSALALGAGGKDWGPPSSMPTACNLPRSAHLDGAPRRHRRGAGAGTRLYGVLDAAERGSVARWRASALGEVAAAVAAGRLPIVVGGGGLLSARPDRGPCADPGNPGPGPTGGAGALPSGGRRRLPPAAWRSRVAAERLAPGDPQRLVRAYEVVPRHRTADRLVASSALGAPPYRFATILMMPPRAALYAACDARLEAMIKRPARRSGGTLAPPARSWAAGDEGGRDAA